MSLWISVLQYLNNFWFSELIWFRCIFIDCLKSLNKPTQSNCRRASSCHKRDKPPIRFLVFCFISARLIFLFYFLFSHRLRSTLMEDLTRSLVSPRRPKHSKQLLIWLEGKALLWRLVCLQVWCKVYISLFSFKIFLFFS